MSKKTRVGIGVTTRNRPELLEKCVENIRKFTGKHKLVVVDDFSDVPAKVKYAKVHRFEKNVGIAICKNRCLKLLKNCDHIFLFDDDCWPIVEGWEEIYVETALNSGNHHLNYTFSYMSDNSPAQGNEVVRVVKSMQYSLDENYREVEEKVLWSIKKLNNCCGCMIYLTNECLQKVGGFNTDFGLYGGEHLNWSHRAHNLGMTPLGVFLDVKNSEELFYARDRMANKKFCSVLPEEQVYRLAEAGKLILERERKSIVKLPYK